MTTNRPDEFPALSFEQFNYRIVYMRPSQYSDERVAVGLVSESVSGIQTRFLTSVGPLELMGRLFGVTGVEQFHFAANELQISVQRERSLDELRTPTDLLVFGERISAVTRDREGLVRSLLENASCLVRAESPRAREAFDEPTTRLCTTLFEQVSLLNPMTANDLFRQRITVEAGEMTETVTLPILGRKIFGAPISFVAASWDQKIRAEAYIAKFRWLRQFLSQEPNVYVLTPQHQSGRIGAKAESHVRELREVANASDVRLRVSTSTEELASLIVRDEAA
jgi:hypothetical protein